jgi:ADA HAT complex component 1
MAESSVSASTSLTGSSSTSPRVSEPSPEARESTQDIIAPPEATHLETSNPPLNMTEQTPDSQDPRQELLKRLQKIPIEQLKEIITTQIDLEIRLKHQELQLTETEVNKIESQMILLRKFFDIPNDVKLSSEPSDFTIKYFDVLNKSLTLRYNEIKRQQENPDYGDISNYSYGGALFKSDYLSPDQESVFAGYGNEFGASSGHTYRTRSTTSSLRPSSFSTAGQQSINTIKSNQPSVGCLYRRTDGIIVRLTCPDCQRSNFSSAQGFLNHSRIAHAKEYTSQDAAALKCGEILTSVKQDPEGEASLQNLLKKNLDPNKNLNVNEIYFHGLSNTLNTVHDSVKSSKPEKPESSNKSVPSGNSEKSLAGPRESELMKKLTKGGKMKKEEYEQLLDEAQMPVANAHLFENEVEEEDVLDEDQSPISDTENMKSILKRRKSRGGININFSQEHLEVESEQQSSPDVSNLQEEKDKQENLKRRRKA